MGSLLNTIALGGTNVPSAQDYAAKAAELANQRAALAHTQEVTRGQALTNTEKEVELQDARIMREAFQKASADPSLDPVARGQAILQHAIKGGASVKAVMGLQSALTAQQEAITGLQTKQLAADAERHNALLGKLDAFMAQPPDQQQVGYGAFLQDVTKSGLVTPQEAASFPTGYPGSDVMQHFAQGLQLHTAQQAHELENRKVAAEEKKAAADKQKAGNEAERLAAEKSGLEAESKMKVIEAAAMASTTPESSDAQVDSVVDPAKYPDINKAAKAEMRAAIQGGLHPAARQGILADAAKQAEERAKAVDPALEAARVKHAVDIEKATAPIKEGQAVAVARAMAGGQGTPLESVAAKDISKVKADYEKSANAYATALTHAEEIQRVLDMAAAGNKAAGANAPLVGVGATNAVNGVKRINSAEINQYGTAGSLLDKIQGKLQGWTTGQPIPKDVLDDMKEFHRQLSEGATAQHEREVRVLNKTYGAKLEPMKFESKSSGAIPTPATQKEYDDLPKGAKFHKPGDPEVYTKK